MVSVKNSKTNDCLQLLATKPVKTVGMIFGLNTGSNASTGLGNLLLKMNCNGHGPNQICIAKINKGENI